MGIMIGLQAAGRICLVLSFILSSFLFGGCTVTPDEETVKSSIVHYFETRHYRVIRLDMADIKPLPLSEKVYMGTEGYIVNIKLITVEAMRDSTKSRGRGEGGQLTFMHAVFQIREKAGERGRWEVSVISGVPLL